MQLIAVECKYIDFYIEQGYCVCLWNYRGYGQSTGVPSLSKNEKDVLQLYDYLTKQGYSPTIAHGYSIGGPVAIYLAANRPIDMLIADRTFGSIDLVRSFLI
jgi:pimeloyl-ACP methyl ester carboxylesterase